MRIITGMYRGRKLETPDNYDIRPTSDKVRESIFNLLMGRVEDAVVCDLFAGTGALGIEALSRGAKRVYFGDHSRDAIRLLHGNIQKCGPEAEERSVVMAGDYRRTLGKLREKADIFLLDPPYRAGLYENCLNLIDQLDLLALEGIILAEHESRETLPDEIGGLVKTKSRRYGKTTVDIYVRKAAEETAETAEGSDD